MIVCPVPPQKEHLNSSASSLFVVKPAGALERNKLNWAGTVGEYMAFRWSPRILTAIRGQTRPQSQNSDVGLTFKSRIPNVNTEL